MKLVQVGVETDCCLVCRHRPNCSICTSPIAANILSTPVPALHVNFWSHANHDGNTTS